MDDEYLFVPLDGGRHKKILRSQLIYIEGGRDYRKIVTESRTYHTKRSMDQLAAMLNGKGFCRIHRSYIISFAHLTLVEHYWVTIHDKNLPISDSYRKAFFDQITLLS
ncbi:LytR/AlgR family response regulator transcription factor [Filimonas effusa]|uniref:LytTR family transcriptional regulator n=1 Tax=Filimonas effusa TaxID=2508721 RepID=A0A4Q1DCS5_9BACT|nr:LytTR family DNA-binding domain-containing protein [Filimonas effusa]RXK87334.1 LytTR family transcriptional regulator [Filimonas effusa]